MYSTIDKYFPKSTRENYRPMSVEDAKDTLHTVSTVRKPSLNIPKNVSTSDPRIWGPAFWFSLHTVAAHYPLQASPIVAENMKARIKAIPYEVPCESCRSHAFAYIDSNSNRLDEIVSGRHALGRFFCDFHNKVNARYNKPQMSYEDVYKMYSGNAEL